MIKPGEITFYPRNREEWRNWLEINHEAATFVWLVFYKKNSGNPTIIYSDAVDEALCFGWIDSKLKPVDEMEYHLFFCKRKPKSVWSKVNKEKVESLIASGKMTTAGLATIEMAKENGYWSLLDGAEALEIPPPLEAAFRANQNVELFFTSLSRTDKRNILQWLALAKRPETLQKRIGEIIECGIIGLKPKPFR
jgi:uncharacterized protein YdeI (YjbR/CyaY-like superfamily)